MTKSGNGSLSITWLGHATLLIELGGLRVLTDPVLGRRAGLLRRLAPPVRREALEQVDAVLVSHAHADHLDPRSFRRVRTAGPVLAPPAAARFLRRHAGVGVREVTAGDSVEIRGVNVNVVRAVHDGRRWPRGPHAEAVGYVVQADAAVYFAGDTDLYPEMAALTGRIDVALIPVWGWGPSVGDGHLTPHQAAEAVTIVAPRVAIPVHWGTLGLPWKRPSGEELHAPARAFADEAARVAPDVEVRVLEPGERTTVRPAPRVEADGR